MLALEVAQAPDKTREAEQLIFATRLDHPLDPTNVLKIFYHLRDTAGLPPERTIHHLRHSHISHLVLAGVPILEVARRAGHANPAITLQRYGHLTPGYVGSATKAVEMALYAPPTQALE
jgi:integrase